MILSNSIYYQQAQFLVRILPLVFTEECFALKGGTAINLFIRNLPRLSVDIDLVYLPFNSRADALNEIHQALSRIAENLENTFQGIRVHRSFEDKNDALRLIVSLNNVQIKVELSPVLRGTVFEPEHRMVCDSVEEQFGFVEIPVVSLEDLYGGKICAALDRQHPRDLFDIWQLLSNEGISDTIRKTSLVYIISHPTPISELIDPRLKDITSIFQGEFSGMTVEPVTLQELERSREALIKSRQSGITANEKEFLVSFKNGTPDWTLLELDNIEKLPAVQWKLQNLSRMNPQNKKKALEKLIKVLD